MKPLFLAFLVLLAVPAWALEYRSTARAAILYDAPSTASARLLVVGRQVPLEVVVDAGDWVKVRDADGRLAWVEKAALGGRPSVMVRVEEGTIRRQPTPDAEPVFRATRGVLLEALGEPNALGWLQVRHANGLTGWLRIQDLWGL